MTRELDSKSTGLTALKDSADEPGDVRALLIAGSSDDLGYDFERGLSAHLAAIGAPPAPGHVSEPGGTGAAGAKGAAALASKPLLLLLGIPAAAASIALALWLGAGARGASSGGAGVRTAEKIGAPAVPVADLSPTPAVAPPARVAASPEPAAPALGAAPAGGSRPERTSISAPRASAGSVAAEHVTLEETGETTPSAGAALPSAAGAIAARGTDSLHADSVESAPSPSAAAERAEEEAVRRREERAEAANRLADERFQKEMRGLVEAKRALSDDPGHALALARQGEHDFPHGVFSEERQHILILALVGLGRLDEARRAAAPYLAQHPDSPFARRVQTALDAAARSRH